MALLKRELHKASRSPVLNDEDQWHLVFDTDSKRLYVEHRWTHFDVRGPDVADSGTTQLDIAEYLNQGGQTAGHRELWRWHRQLDWLWSRQGRRGRPHERLCPSGHAGDLGPGLEGLGPGGAILTGGEVIAAEVEEVVDPIVGREEALGLTG